jgi:hypothetical protein
MAEPLPPIQFEDIPLDEARRMGRGPRMDPQLYQELRRRIPVLSSSNQDALRICLMGHSRRGTPHILWVLAAFMTFLLLGGTAIAADVDFVGVPMNTHSYTMSVAPLTPGGAEQPFGTLNDGFGNLSLLLRPDQIGLGALFSSGRSHRDMRVADLNGDGVPDLVSNVYNSHPNHCGSPNSVSLLFFQNKTSSGAPAGTFTENSSFRAFGIRGRGETIVIADFNHDRALDVFIPQSADPHVRRLPLSGDGLHH